MRTVTAKQVKKEISEIMTDRKMGISVSLWEPHFKDGIDRIVIKFPRSTNHYIGLSYLHKKVLEKYGFHVAQILGFMEDKKLWILITRDRRR